MTGMAFPQMLSPLAGVMVRAAASSAVLDTTRTLRAWPRTVLTQTLGGVLE